MDLKAKMALHQKKKPVDLGAHTPTGTDDAARQPSGEEVVRETVYTSLIAEEFSLLRLLPARRMVSESGEYLFVEYRYPLSHFHGRFDLGALQRENLQALCGVLKDQALLCPKDLRSLLFMDTETTGLQGGAGTYAFMVGLGYFTDEEFVLCQYMMEDYHQELAMLVAIYEKMQEHTHLVTFNGKTFDWPLLESRFTYHRMRGGLRPVQVDLVHPARRYYKQRLENCRLGSLEEAVLGFGRAGDISGAEVPSLFFRYVEERDGRLIAPVFQHNHWDILTLVTLLTHLVQAYCEPGEVLEKAEDLFSAGKIHADLGEYEQAIACFKRSLDNPCSPQLKQEILTHLSYVYKRLGRFEDASTIWQNFIQSASNMRIFPYLELAKYFEHQCKDYQRALEVTEAARALLLGQRRHYTASRLKEWLSDLDHRRERLQKKCVKQEEKFVQLHIQED